MTADDVKGTALMFWTSPTHECLAGLERWPGYFVQAFKTQPTVSELRVAFQKSYNAGHRSPPAFEWVKRTIFAGRQASANEQAERASVGRPCPYCRNSGCVTVLYHVANGQRRVITPGRPAAVNPRELYSGAVPCSCAAGDAVNLGWKQALSDTIDGKTAKTPGYVRAIRERLVRCAVTPDTERELRAACDAMYCAERGIPADMQEFAVRKDGPAWDALVARVIDRASARRSETTAGVDDNTVDAVVSGTGWV